MTDRELLELAAKAAGITLTPVEIKNVTKQGDDRFIGYRTDPYQWTRGWFDPLADDGDALRLAVKLEMDFVWDFDRIEVYYGVEKDYAVEYFYELPTPTDRYAATRRAIVRAAAEIGRNMK